jgi:hypothetical protein
MEIMRDKERKRHFGKYFGKEIKWAFAWHGRPFPRHFLELERKS